jgi:hypothetical protein
LHKLENRAINANLNQNGAWMKHDNPHLQDT